MYKMIIKTKCWDIEGWGNVQIAQLLIRNWMRNLCRIEWLKTNFKIVKSPEMKTYMYYLYFKDNPYRTLKTKEVLKIKHERLIYYISEYTWKNAH